MGTETEIVFTVTEDEADGGYVANAPGITTQAESIAELREMVIDAVRCHFDGEPPERRPKLPP
jgi:predicted RNase H-like HicB family nuclease